MLGTREEARKINGMLILTHQQQQQPLTVDTDILQLKAVPPYISAL